MAYADDHVATYNPNALLKIVTKKGATDDSPCSRKKNGGLVEADFDKTVRMYLVPNLADKDSETLRNGGRIARSRARLVFRKESTSC